MERGRSPLVSIPPFGRGSSRLRGLPIRCGFYTEAVPPAEIALPAAAVQGRQVDPLGLAPSDCAFVTDCPITGRFVTECPMPKPAEISRSSRFQYLNGNLELALRLLFQGRRSALMKKHLRTAILISFSILGSAFA